MGPFISNWALEVSSPRGKWSGACKLKVNRKWVVELKYKWVFLREKGAVQQGQISSVAMEEYTKYYSLELQKSRITWLQEGERNTRFFHTSAIIRRRRNRVERLQLEPGVWCEEQDKLREAARNFYMQQLYTKEMCKPCILDQKNVVTILLS